MAAYAHLKNEFMEDEKCHNLMRWLSLYTFVMWIFFNEFQRAMNWASAYDGLDAPLQTEPGDCPTVSAGKNQLP